jgi:hypothetical protein
MAEYKNALEYIKSKESHDFHKKNKETKKMNVAKKMGDDNYGSKATRAKFTKEKYEHKLEKIRREK